MQNTLRQNCQVLVGYIDVFNLPSSCPLNTLSPLLTVQLMDPTSNAPMATKAMGFPVRSCVR